ncbi:MAG: PAS domain S-box protein [Flavitalea sp.]
MMDSPDEKQNNSTNLKSEMLPGISPFDETTILAAIVQGSDDAIISKTLDGIITSWNAAAERIFGYVAQEMIGTSISKIIPHDRQNEEPEILRKLQRGERVEHFETKRIGKFNNLIDISLTISPIKDKSGKIVGASKIARDITEQKVYERMIREGEERFRMAMESTRLGTWEYDCVSGALNWSAECRKMYEFPDGLEVDYSLFSSLIHPEDEKFVQNAIESAMIPGGKGNYNIEYRILRYSDNETRWIKAQGKVYFSPDNRPERFIGTVLDITEEKVTKDLLVTTVNDRTRELVEINRELEKSNNELEQFAYIASHDLQEPLRKILTYTNLLQIHFDEKENANKYFEKITTAAYRMSRLIQDVLNYSRLSEEKSPHAEIDLNEVLQDVLSDYELLIEEKGVAISYSILPLISASSPQIHQLFGNLISNAIKFSRESPKIEICSRILTREEAQSDDKILRDAKSYIEISFADNGIGFERQYSEQIFIIFQRLNTRQQYAGTGIGLALCQKIVQNHGGIIYAEGKPGLGATITIVLPLS